MAASLKLVANNAETAGALNAAVFTDSLHELRLNSGAHTQAQLPAKTSYRALATVVTAHIVVIAAIATSQTQQIMPAAQKEQPITVSLLTAPSPASESKIEPVKAEPVVQKIKPQPSPVATKPAVTETPLQTAAVSQPKVEQTPGTEQKQREPAKAETVALSKAAEATAAPAAKEVAAAEQEAVVEPPKFGAAYLNNPAPKYPPSSRRAGEQGRVLLKVLVSEQGTPEEIELDTSSGFERLDQAAMDAVKKWSFIPAKRSNQPTSAYVLVPVKFLLNS